jgi:hypothetical protein
MPPPAQASIQPHIKGPGLIGPLLSSDDALRSFDDAPNVMAGPVSILLAGSVDDVVELTVRWATHRGEDWLVGTETTRESLEAAYAESANLRVLIAVDVSAVSELTRDWLQAG